MIKGTTKSGFNYTIQESALDDYELLEELREIDKGNTSLIVDVIEKIIGSEQKEQLKKHVRDETGRFTINRMVAENGEFLRGNKQEKTNNTTFALFLFRLFSICSNSLVSYRPSGFF